MFKFGNKLREESNFSKDDGYQNIFQVYKEELNRGQTQYIINRGMKRTSDVLTTYEQEKKCNTSFYYKRKVLDDGVSTVPLDVRINLIQLEFSSI